MLEAVATGVETVLEEVVVPVEVPEDLADDACEVLDVDVACVELDVVVFRFLASRVAISSSSTGAFLATTATILPASFK